MSRVGEKKVVLFIVESSSEEAALGSVMKEYFSGHVEHVLYGELRDFSDEEKQILSDDFADRYEGKPEEFIEFISDRAIAAAGTYQKTWDFIEKGIHSLNRGSNMHLIFDF